MPQHNKKKPWIWKFSVCSVSIKLSTLTWNKNFKKKENKDTTQFCHVFLSTFNSTLCLATGIRLGWWSCTGAILNLELWAGVLWIRRKEQGLPYPCRSLQWVKLKGWCIWMLFCWLRWGRKMTENHSCREMGKTLVNNFYLEGVSYTTNNASSFTKNRWDSKILPRIFSHLPLTFHSPK